MLSIFSCVCRLFPRFSREMTVSLWGLKGPASLCFSASTLGISWTGLSLPSGPRASAYTPSACKTPLPLILTSSVGLLSPSICCLSLCCHAHGVILCYSSVHLIPVIGFLKFSNGKSCIWHFHHSDSSSWLSIGQAVCLHPQLQSNAGLKMCRLSAERPGTLAQGALTAPS